MEISSTGEQLDLISFAQLPDDARPDFDYITGGEEVWANRMFHFRGQWYDVNDFDALRRASAPRDANPRVHVVADDSALLAWDGIQTDSAFSAVVVKYLGEDCGRVIAGAVSW
jgi:hypothetical protein